MAQVKPIAGYASTTEAVLTLADEGLVGAKISARLGVKLKTVTGVLSRCGEINTREVISIDEETWASIEAAAEKRGVHPHKLASDALRVLASDHLWAAVLDTPN